LIDSGETCLGGRLPVNTCGGLKAKGHPVGATGTAQTYEITSNSLAKKTDARSKTPKWAYPKRRRLSATRDSHITKETTDMSTEPFTLEQFYKFISK
jgi:acetyl-CoA acetyltransferase